MNAIVTRMILSALLTSCLASAAAVEPPAAAPPQSAKAQHVPDDTHCGPPPEAYQACVGKTVGTRAEFVGSQGEKVAGQCLNDENGKIVLRPDHPPTDRAGGHRGPPPEAYQACAGKTLGNAAQFNGPNGEVIEGTCQTEGDKLVLRPTHRPTPKDR